MPTVTPPSVATESAAPARVNRRLARAKHVVPNKHFIALASQVISLRTKCDEHKSVGVASCFRGEGRTTVASNLAIAIKAAIPGGVLIVNAAEGRRSFFSRSRGPGWLDLAFGDAELMDVIQETDTPNLFVMRAGEPPKGQACLTYNPPRLANIVEMLKEKFEFVVFDLPCADDMTGCLPIASVLDGVILVLKSDRVNSTHATRVKRQFAERGANVLGAVLNQTRSYIPGLLRRWLRITDPTV